MTSQQTDDVRRKKKKSFIWNLVTILVLLATACLLFYFITIFRNPGSQLNLFPPVPTPTVFFTATPTITPIQLPATWTPTLTASPASTRTRASTWTMLPGFASDTFTPQPSFTITPENTSTSPVSVTITYHPGTDIYPDSACNWMAIGGSIVDTDGTPLLFYPVELGGSLNGEIISQLKLSGSAPNYGTSGFEFQLADHPIASTKTLYLQVFQELGGALTDKIYIDTFEDCTRNLLRITFTVTR
jgi:hypothetical protein